MNENREYVNTEEIEEFQGRSKKNKKDDSNSLKPKDLIKDLIIVVVVLIIIGFFVKPIVVDGTSMIPTLENKDYLLISKQAYKFGEPERGDIVVFPHIDANGEESLYIKRVIAIPGDRLEIYDGDVYINGDLQKEKYIKNGAVTEGDINLVIPAGEIFVMGDNRENSSDSRFFGTVNIEDVTGRVFVRLLPISEFGKP